MSTSLDVFIREVRAAIGRGLPITAEHVLQGLEYAVANKAFGGAVRFDTIGAPRVEYLARQPQAQSQNPFAGTQK